MNTKLKIYSSFVLIGAFSFVVLVNAQAPIAPGAGTPPPMPTQFQNMGTAITNSAPTNTMMPPKQDKGVTDQTQQPVSLGAPQQQDAQTPPQKDNQQGSGASQKKLQQLVAIEPNGNAVVRGTLISIVSGSMVIKSWGITFTVDTTKVKNVTTLDITKFTVGDIVGVTGKISDTGTITAKTILNRSLAPQPTPIKKEPILKQTYDLKAGLPTNQGQQGGTTGSTGNAPSGIMPIQDSNTSGQKPKMAPPIPPLPPTGLPTPTTTQ